MKKELITNYKGCRIYKTKKGTYEISYMYSFDIWRKNFKTIQQCKNKITRARNTLKNLPISKGFN